MKQLISLTPPPPPPSNTTTPAKVLTLWRRAAGPPWPWCGRRAGRAWRRPGTLRAQRMSVASWERAASLGQSPPGWTEAPRRWPAHQARRALSSCSEPVWGYAEHLFTLGLLTLAKFSMLSARSARAKMFTLDWKCAQPMLPSAPLLTQLNMTSIPFQPPETLLLWWEWLAINKDARAPFYWWLARGEVVWSDEETRAFMDITRTWPWVFLTFVFTFGIT